MTSRARFVLEDARVALALHTQAKAGPAFRASWFAVIGLLRAVGHVLEKIDGASDSHLANAVSVCWKELNASRPEPAIYWGFIEGERNRFIKNYEHGITRLQIIRTGSSNNVLALDLANAGKATQLVSVYNILPELPDRSVISVLADGPFAGHAETHVASQAIDWWNQYLVKVESLARQYAEA